MSQAPEPLTISATDAEKISRGIEDLVRAVGTMPPMDELKQQMDEVEASLQEVASFVRSLIELLGIPLASDSAAILAEVIRLKSRAAQPEALAAAPLTDEQIETIAYESVPPYGAAPHRKRDCLLFGRALLAAAAGQPADRPNPAVVDLVDEVSRQIEVEQGFFDGTGRRRNLIRAAAFILAKVDEFDRGARSGAGSAKGGAA